MTHQQQAGRHRADSFDSATVATGATTLASLRRRQATTTTSIVAKSGAHHTNWPATPASEAKQAVSAAGESPNSVN